MIESTNPLWDFHNFQSVVTTLNAWCYCIILLMLIPVPPAVFLLLPFVFVDVALYHTVVCSFFLLSLFTYAFMSSPKILKLSEEETPPQENV